MYLTMITRSTGWSHIIYLKWQLLLITAPKTQCCSTPPFTQPTFISCRPWRYRVKRFHNSGNIRGSMHQIKLLPEWRPPRAFGIQHNQSDVSQCYCLHGRPKQARRIPPALETIQRCPAAKPGRGLGIMHRTIDRCTHAGKTTPPPVVHIVHPLTIRGSLGRCPAKNTTCLEHSPVTYGCP